MQSFGAHPIIMRPPGATGDLPLMGHLWEWGLAGLLMSKGFMNKLVGVKIYLHVLGWQNNANSLHNFLPVLMLLSSLLLQCICYWVCCPQFTTPLCSPGSLIQTPNFSISWESRQESSL